MEIIGHINYEQRHTKQTASEGVSRVLGAANRLVELSRLVQHSQRRIRTHNPESYKRVDQYGSVRGQVDLSLHSLLIADQVDSQGWRVCKRAVSSN